jgi:hypothetical protein
MALTTRYGKHAFVTASRSERLETTTFFWKPRISGNHGFLAVAAAALPTFTLLTCSAEGYEFCRVHNIKRL